MVCMIFFYNIGHQCTTSDHIRLQSTTSDLKVSHRTACDLEKRDQTPMYHIGPKTTTSDTNVPHRTGLQSTTSDPKEWHRTPMYHIGLRSTTWDLNVPHRTAFHPEKRDRRFVVNNMANKIVLQWLYFDTTCCSWVGCRNTTRTSRFFVYFVYLVSHQASITTR
jgi:hypothetical protein